MPAVRLSGIGAFIGPAHQPRLLFTACVTAHAHIVSKQQNTRGYTLESSTAVCLESSSCVTRAA